MTCTRNISISGLALLAALAGQAAAQSDRTLTTPANWLWAYGVNTSDLSTYVSQGFRPFSLDRIGDTAFDTVMVANSGSYQHTPFAYFAGTTPANLSSYIAANNMRLIDLKPYATTSATTGFAACLITNTGADAAGWGYLYDQTQAGINSWVSSNPTQRLISLSKYTVSGTPYYAGVMVSNTGANATNWWYYYDVTAAQINGYISTNNARLTNIQCTVDPTASTVAKFTCIMVANTGQNWWWYPGLTTSQISDTVGLNAARLVNLDRHLTATGDTVFSVIMVDNANALSAQVRQIAASGLTTGVGGGYMKEVGGPELCSVGADYVFEPASMLKILYGAYCIDQCAAGADSLGSSIYVANRCTPDGCPDTDGLCNAGNDTLDYALAQMLQNSDNNRTKSIHDRYGRTTLNNYALSLGMTNTQINHDIGCGTPPNHLTLRDAGHLYELIANGSLFNSTWQTTLYQHMLNADGNVGSFSTNIDSMAAQTSLTGSEVATFKSLCFMAEKGGGYGVPPPSGGACCVYDETNGGSMKLPFKDAAGNVVYHSYVIESFTNNEPSQTAAGDTDSSIWWTMADDRILAALQSWDAACTPPAITHQPSPVTATIGGQVQLTVQYTGTAPTFQWRRDNVALTNGAGPGGSTISGATSATLHITNASPLNEGQYTVGLTNTCGSLTINSVRVGVYPPCGSADFNCDGDSGTDADIESFFRCVAGNCPAAPCTSTADFNGDGDVGTDADIEAFFRVLAGGPC